MQSLTYISRATTHFTPEALEQLTDAAAERNLTLDISGCLLYSEGHFLQYIEGPDPAILQLEQALTTDPRHRIIHRLTQLNQTYRRFPCWHMQHVDSNTIAALGQTTHQLSMSNWTQINYKQQLQQQLMKAITLLADQYLYKINN